MDFSYSKTEELFLQMIRSFARNQKRGTMSGKLFEIGKVFIPKDLPLTDYPLVVCDEAALP